MRKLDTQDIISFAMQLCHLQLRLQYRQLLLLVYVFRGHDLTHTKSEEEGILATTAAISRSIVAEYKSCTLLPAGSRHSEN